MLFLPTMLAISPQPSHPVFNSRFVLVLWAVVFVAILLFIDVWRIPGPKSVLSWDVFGYYAYLPAGLLHHDLLRLQELRELYEAYSPSSYFYAAYPMDNGNYGMSYTMGLAILYLPFFLLGHLVAIIAGVPADGLSWPYQLAIYFGSGAYAFLGLVVMRKVLLRFFQDGIVACCLLILIFSTNYFFYSFIENPMSHSYLFTLYALMLWLTIKWHETFKWKYAVSMGFVIGFIILIRPTDIVALLIPLLWGITNKETAVAKAKTLWQHKTQLLALAFCTFLVGLPQMLYWKYSSGQYFYYSYRGLGFDFANPHLMDGIFSLRKGWLVYTPAMALAIIGFIPLYFSQRFLFWGAFLFALINVYIVFSWSVWYYGGGFGARAMVQSYAVMLVPLGALLVYVQSKRLLRWVVALLLVLFTFHNLFQTWQYHQRMHSTAGMTDYVYNLLFLNPHVDKGDIMALDHREQLPMDEGLQEQSLLDTVFEDTLVLPGHTEQHVLLDTAMALNPDNWVQVRVSASFDHREYDYALMAKTQIKFFDAQGKVLKKAQVKLQNLLGNDVMVDCDYYFGQPKVWDEIVFASQAPKGTKRVLVFLKNPGHGSTVDVRHVGISLWSGRVN